MGHYCIQFVRTPMLCVSAEYTSHRLLYPDLCNRLMLRYISQCVVTVRFEKLHPFSAAALLSEAGPMLWRLLCSLGRVCSLSDFTVAHYHMHSHLFLRRSSYLNRQLAAVLLQIFLNLDVHSICTYCQYCCYAAHTSHDVDKT